MADVEPAQGRGDIDTVFDVEPRLVVRRDAAVHARRRQEVRDDAVGTDDVKAFVLQLRDHRREQPVVAERRPAQPGEKPHRPSVGPERAQGRALEPAGQHQLFDSGLLEQLQALARGAQADPGMGRIGNGPGLGVALEGEDEKRAPGGAACGDEPGGQLPAARKNAEFRRHAPLSAGTWRGRSRSG